jgi:hypothetical protein
MNRSAVLIASVCLGLLSGCDRSDGNQVAIESAAVSPIIDSSSVQLTIRAEGWVAKQGFKVLLVEFPDPQVSYCPDTTPIETLQFTEATQATEGGAYEWQLAVQIGPEVLRSDSLVICGYQKSRWKPVWHRRIRPAEGKRLYWVDCWIGKAFESDCQSRTTSGL